MFLSTRARPQRRGIILLVVLALITLFASIGVAFVYYAEAEATKSQDQKAGETIKLPDADLMLNYVLRQLVFPTGNNNSALYTHSLLENMYGYNGINSYNGSGRIPRFDNTTGQDDYFKINYQYRTYDEAVYGSLNPTYSYPDHKNVFMATVAANWTQPNGTQHGPVAIARSFAREMKFRVQVTNSGNPLANYYQDVVINPFTAPDANKNPDYGFWVRGATGNFFIKQLTTGPANADLPTVTAPFAYTATPGATAAAPNLLLSPLPTIQTDTTGSFGWLVMDAATCLQHSLRPNPRVHPNFPPPPDLGGDVKNLPPEVKTLVGFNGTTPIFANNDSYWMDIGFPAIPISNNRKVKALAALFIKDNDGNVNLNVAGNLRGKGGFSGSTFHTSAHGQGPWEINLAKLGVTTGDLQNLIAGARNPFLVQGSFVRGRGGYAPDQDPPALPLGVAPSAPLGYTPILRTAPFFSLYNFDGTTDVGLYAYNASNPWQLTGDSSLPVTATSFMRFPIFSNTAGFNSGGIQEWIRAMPFPAPNDTANNSPLFFSPYAPNQVTSTNASAVSPTGITATQRTFGLQNQEALYRLTDTGNDKINSDVRWLAPSAFLSPQQRWQMTMHSNDLNVRGIAPWWNQAAKDFGMPAFPAYQQPSALPVAMPTTMPAIFNPGTEFSNSSGYSWRSIFGNLTRIDLARQLPDYPLPPPPVGSPAGSPPDPNAQLATAQPIVLAQYRIALQARQKMALEIYNRLEEISHPKDTDTKRWLAQLAVNIVDYIDNDDYPTWLVIPGQPATSDNIVWGTELPRLVINEVYSEAVNFTGDANPPTHSYNVRHWVELYNPLEDSTFGTWPEGTKVRLNIGGTSVYRLIITPHNNATNIRNNSNTMGALNSTMDGKTNKVLFPAGAVIAASGANYGDGSTSGDGVTTGSNNPSVPNVPGYYLVCPTSAPVDASGAPINTAPVAVGTPLNFPNPNSPSPNILADPNMEVTERIATASGPFQDNADNRQTILLQRLANPYLPFNPVPETTTNTVNFPGETTSALTPYNPYITIDYVDNLSVQHAVQHDKAGNPDSVPVEQRKSVGKIQPYTSINDIPLAGTTESVWMEQRPNRVIGSATFAPLQGQPQHTFLRHNAVEANYPMTVAPSPPVNPYLDSAISAPFNTLRVPVSPASAGPKTPFDWLTHLDRAPMSPAELLHVSGFKPHELTQQFNRLATVTVTFPPIAPPTVPPTTTVTAGPKTFTGTWYGSFNGIPWKVKQNDLVRVTYTEPAAPNNRISEWVMVTSVAANYSSFTANTTQAGTYLATIDVQPIVPFAHYAPWSKVTLPQSVATSSNNRIYRLLESVAVRNPGIDVGQYRFTSTSTNNVGPLLPDGSRWIQLDAITNNNLGNTNQISTNDALLNLLNSDVVNANPYGNPTDTLGDLLVIRTVGAGNFEKRSIILDMDRANNRIRTVLYEDPAAAIIPPAGGSLTLMLDYTYVAGRQPGRINLNSVWDIETWRALADAQNMNSFIGPAAYTDQFVDRVYRRLYQQRQPGFFYTPRMVGHTGIFGATATAGEDRPFQGMGVGDVQGGSSGGVLIPWQGIGNTFLSDRYQEAGQIPAVTLDPGDNTNDRFLRTLFEVDHEDPSNPQDNRTHPFRRYELLSKIWNNSTVRSNTFSVWITIGFFEYDDATGLGAEVGQIQGKNTRYRFFAMVDRTTIDSWLRAWSLHDSTANINLFSNSSIFPSLDPRYETYPQQTAISTANAGATYPPPANQYSKDPASVTDLPGNTAYKPGTWRVNLVNSTNPFITDTSVGRLVQVTSDTGSEIGQVVAQSAVGVSPAYMDLRLALAHNGVLTIRPLPVPPTVLYWTQLK